MTVEPRAVDETTRQLVRGAVRERFQDARQYLATACFLAVITALIVWWDAPRTVGVLTAAMTLGYVLAGLRARREARRLLETIQRPRVERPPSSRRPH